MKKYTLTVRVGTNDVVEIGHWETLVKMLRQETKTGKLVKLSLRRQAA